MPRRGTRRRGRTSPAASPTVPGVAGQHGAPTWISSVLLGSEGARTGWWTSREAIAGVGAAASARWRCWRPNSRGGAEAREGRRARGCARASGYYCRRAGLGSRREVAAVFTVEPGSTPWVAASAAPAIGSRECVWVHGGSRARPRRPRTRFPLPSPTRDRAWGSRSR
jgi:hypothetical protein